MECKTVAVKTEDGHMVINEEDYDPDTMELVDLPEAPAPAAAADDTAEVPGPATPAEGEGTGETATPDDGLDAMKVSELRAKVKEADIKLADIEGSGEGGNVIKDDLVRVLRNPPKPAE